MSQVDSRHPQLSSKTHLSTRFGPVFEDAALSKALHSIKCGCEHEARCVAYRCFTSTPAGTQPLRFEAIPPSQDPKA